MSHDEEPEEEKDEAGELDLILENEALRNDLKMMGMAAEGKADDLDPALENEFLRYVKWYEEAESQPQEPIRSLFPEGFEFPPVASMTAEQLAAKLDAIGSILERHQIVLGLCDGIPDAVAYDYFVNEVFEEHTVFPDPPENFHQHIDGCGGACEACFQKDYCDTAKEILEEGRDE